MTRFIAPLLVFGVLVFFFVKGLDPERKLNELPSPFVGKMAPAFDLPKLGSPRERISNTDYAGKMALVNFWATWCVGCRQEHQFLMELSREDQLPIYGIDWRDQQEPALSWLRQLGDPYIATGFDEDASVGIDWGVYGAPETFLIGKDGRVLLKYMGPLNWSVWNAQFVPLIKAEKGLEQ